MNEEEAARKGEEENNTKERVKVQFSETAKEKGSRAGKGRGREFK
jgi:hypothetical protein